MRLLLLVLLLLLLLLLLLILDVLMKNDDDGFLFFLNKYLLLYPNPITPTLLLHNTTCLFTATYSPRIRDDDVNVNNKTATTGCSVLSLLDRREKNKWVPINPKPCKILLYRPTCDRMDLQRPKSNNKQRARISNNVIISLRATLYCNKLTRARRSVTHTHDAFKQQRVLVLRRRKKSMGTYIFQAEVFLSLCGMWIRRLDVFFSRRAQTHAGARVSETSRRARNALSHELRYPTK